MLCNYCNEHTAVVHCGRQCETAFYCNQECADADFEFHGVECIGAPLRPPDIKPGSIAGGGAYGVVIRSKDGKYAMKIQNLQSAESCEREGKIQQELSQLRNVRVPKLYYYSARWKAIPTQVRGLLSTNAKGIEWQKTQWAGAFCITIFDYVATISLPKIKPVNMPAFAFAFLYSLNKANVRLGFQHLDLHSGNILVARSKSQKLVIVEQTFKRTWSFTKGVELLPYIIDFGLSRTDKMPDTPMAGAVVVMPPEQVFNHITSVLTGQVVNDFAWSYDLWSAGMDLYNYAIINLFGAQGMAMQLPNLNIAYVTDDYVTGMFQLLGAFPAVQIPVRSFLVTLVQFVSLSVALGNVLNYNVWTYFGPLPAAVAFWDDYWANDYLKWLVEKNVLLLRKNIAHIRKAYGNGFISLLASLLRLRPNERGGGRGRIIFHPYFAPYVK